MTVTAIAPPLDIDGPLPVEPEHSLLSVPGVLATPAEALDPDETTPFDRWQSGVAVFGYPSGTPLTFEPCSTGTYRVKDDESNQPTPLFSPIAIYQPITCSTMSMGDPDEFKARAVAVLNATRSHAVEEVLAAGVVNSSNPFLGDMNLVTPAGGTAVSPKVGLGYLENAIGETGRAGMMHATPAVIDQWFANPQTDEAVLRTAAGSLVASGGGYIGLDPIGSGGLPAAPAGGTKDWAFATGPVRAFVTEVMEGPLEIGGAVDQLQNLATFRAERMILVEWDTALQVGVLIDWSLS
jgi:hypothetical protein